MLEGDALALVNIAVRGGAVAQSMAAWARAWEWRGRGDRHRCSLSAWCLRSATNCG